MFKNILIGMIFLTFLSSCIDDNVTPPKKKDIDPPKNSSSKTSLRLPIQSSKQIPKPFNLIKIPLQLAKEKSATAIGITPDGQPIVFNNSTGKVVQSCLKSNTPCNTKIIDPNAEIQQLIKGTTTPYKVLITDDKGNQKPAILTFIAAVTYQQTDELKKINSDSLSFLNPIISTANAQTITQYCTTIYSGGDELQTCIDVGNSCKRWAGIYGKNLVLQYFAQCHKYLD